MNTDLICSYLRQRALSLFLFLGFVAFGGKFVYILHLHSTSLPSELMDNISTT